ncbi:hypothetical protein HDU99_003252, partial [Rhizoclosmatium hyalinum]
EPHSGTAEPPIQIHLAGAGAAVVLAAAIRLLVAVGPPLPVIAVHLPDVVSKALWACYATGR